MTRDMPAIVFMILAASLSGCRDNHIATYSAPKDPAPAPQPPAHAHATANAPSTSPAPAPAPAPQIRWAAPAHWQSAPPASPAAASVRVGSFTITTTAPDGRTRSADMAITTFPGDVGGDLANVNRWRGQLQLAPITAAQLPAAITALAFPAGEFLLVDITSESPPAAADTAAAAAQPRRTLGAWFKQPAQNRTWFFKLTGDADLVAAEREPFLAFLKTIVFDS